MASEFQRLVTYHDKSQTAQLMLKLNEQRKLSRFCDVVLKVCGQQIFAHSNILASASDYFGSFLGCGQDWPRAFSQKTPQIIEIYIDGNDGDGRGYGEAVKKVVDFMYTSKIDITIEVINQVSEIAKIMQMNKILEYCENFQRINMCGEEPEEPVEHIVKASVGTMTEKHATNDYDGEDDDSRLGTAEYFGDNAEDDKVNDPDFEAVLSNGNKKRKRGRPRKKPETIQEDEETDEHLCVFFEDENDTVNDFMHNEQPAKNDDNLVKTENGENEDQPDIVKSEPQSPKPRRCSKRIRKAKERPDFLTHSLADLNKLRSQIESVEEEDCKNKLVEKDYNNSRLRYMCKICNLVCMSLNKYKIHKLSVHTQSTTPVPRRKMTCDKCEYVTKKQHDFKEHVRCHLHDALTCSLCEYQADSQSDFDQHIEKHTGDLPFFCMICDVKFKNRAQQNAHMPKHSEVKPFVCDICDAGFKWKHALKSHMIVHTDTKDHLCDICGFATAHKSMLKAHKLIHSGNTYKCEVINCNFQATKKQNLKYHMLTHTGEKPHQCEICGQSFSLVKNMKRHKLMHSNDKPLRCDIEDCQFGTTRYDKLKEHKLKQHGSGPPPAKKLKLSDYQTLSENQIVHIDGQIISEALAATQNIQDGQIIATVDSHGIIGTVQYADIDNTSGIIHYVTSIE